MRPAQANRAFTLPFTKSRALASDSSQPHTVNTSSNAMEQLPLRQESLTQYQEKLCWKRKVQTFAKIAVAAGITILLGANTWYIMRAVEVESDVRIAAARRSRLVMRQSWKLMGREAPASSPTPSPAVAASPLPGTGSGSAVSIASALTHTTASPAGELVAASPAISAGDAQDVTRDAERYEHQLQAQQLRAAATRVTSSPPAADAIHSSSNSSTTASRRPPRPKAPAPPLAKKPSAKRRRSDLVGVEWNQALVHFANCMRLEFQELTAEFVADDEVTFPAWKTLWTRRCMSAAFHVEFWESTPSTTHQTILQIALELLVCCIEDHGPFEESRAVASLFGFVFALFSAYSVQLGTPKHKIDVDPRSWTALMTIECTCTTGLGSLVYPKASSEVLAILSTLVHKENAFLKCLRGFGYQFRVKSGRVSAAEAREKASEQRRLMSESGLAVSDLETLLKEEQVGQLDILSKQYSDSVGLIDATSTNGTGTPAPTLKPRANKLGAKHAGVSELTQSHEKSRLELLTKLRAYLEAKASIATRRMLETQDLPILELESRQSDVVMVENAKSVVPEDEAENFHFEYDHEELLLPGVQQPSGSSRSRSRVTKAASQQQQQTTADASKARPRSKRTTRSSIASSENDSLALLEAELSRDVYNTPTPAPPRKRQRRSSVASTGSAFTFASDAASDGLAELQAELNASLVVGREAKTGIAQRAIAHVEDDSESFSDSTGDSEYEESDGGLAELEAELEAEVGAKGTKAKPKAKPKAPAKTPEQQPTRKPAVVARQPRALTVVASASALGFRGPGKRKRLLDAVSSVATESDDGLAELQAELELSLAPSVAVPANKPAKARARRATSKKPTPAKQQKPIKDDAPGKKPTRGIAMKRTATSSSIKALDMVSIATESDDGALAELEAELELSTQQESTVPSQPIAKSAKRSNAATSKKNKAAETSVASAGIAPRDIVTRRMRAASIATKSDDGALAELQAELERTVDESKASPSVAATPAAEVAKPARGTRANLKRKRAAPVVAVGNGDRDDNGDVAELQVAPDEPSAPTASAKSPVKPPRATGAKAQAKAREPSAQGIASPRGIAAKRREMSDAVSIATTVSDEDDGGLEELQAELERSVVAAEPASVVEAETAPKRSTRRRNVSEPSSVEVPSTRQSARTRASEKGSKLATTATSPRTTRTRSSAEQSVAKPAKQTTAAKARKAPTVKPVALGKPPTGKAKKKAVVVPKKIVSTKSKKTKEPTSQPAAQSLQAKDSEALAKATKVAAAKQREQHQREGEGTERVSTRLLAKSVSLSPAKASTGSIATSDDGDESDDGLGELEAELQASIA